MTDNEKVLRFSFRGSYDDLEPAENGEIMRAFDYDRLAARAEAAEARIAHLENHIEAVAKDTHKVMLQYETALPTSTYAEMMARINGGEQK